MDTKGESQWTAARGLLSALTTPGMIYGVWGNRNRMLGKDSFGILGTFSPSSESDVEKGFSIASRSFRYPALPAEQREVERKTCPRKRMNLNVLQHKDFCCYL